VVVAEEVVWRGYLTPEIGILFASAAFALHHFHFGWRHVLFAAVAGLLWGALFRIEDGLYSPIAAHLTYNALAWAWLRRPRKSVCRPFWRALLRSRVSASTFFASSCPSAAARSSQRMASLVLFSTPRPLL